MSRCIAMLMCLAMIVHARTDSTCAIVVAAESCGSINSRSFDVVNCRVHCCTAASIDAPCRKTSSMHRESDAYLNYIVDNWNNLPDKIVFLHGHRHSWHQHLDLPDAVQSFMTSTNVPFCSLNKQTIRHNHFDTSIHGRVWEALFNTTPPKIVISDGSAQFAATGRQIRNAPLDTYQKLARYHRGTLPKGHSLGDARGWIEVGTDVSFASGSTDGPAFFWEWIQHIIMGRPAEDASAPLCL